MAHYTESKDNCVPVLRLYTLASLQVSQSIVIHIMMLVQLIFPKRKRRSKFIHFVHITFIKAHINNAEIQPTFSSTNITEYINSSSCKEEGPCTQAVRT